MQDGLPGRGPPPALLTCYIVAHTYALYTWLLWPVLVRSVMRQLTERRGWAKTDREPIAEQASAAPADPA